MELWVDVLRLVNAVLSTLVFGALVYKGRLYYKDYGRHQKLLYLSFTLYALATSYGSVEAYAQDAPAGFRTFAYFVAGAVALFTFMKHKDSAFSPRTPLDGA